MWSDSSNTSAASAIENRAQASQRRLQPRSHDAGKRIIRCSFRWMQRLRRKVLCFRVNLGDPADRFLIATARTRGAASANSTSPAAPVLAAKPDVNPIAPDFRDEGTTLANYRFHNSLAPFEKRLCRLGRRELADEDKELRARVHQYAKRERRIPDTGIPGDGDPPTPADLAYPLIIRSLHPEVIVVSFNSETGITESRWKTSAQISIGEKYELTRLVHMRARP